SPKLIFVKVFKGCQPIFIKTVKDEFWRRYIKRYFRTDSDNKPVFNRKEEIFAEVLRAFPDSSAVEVEYLIESRLKIIAHDENESNGEEK
ncbi:MAG: hypothetical protein AAFN11_16375, partial [Chloroflexota bacterium]